MKYMSKLFFVLYVFAPLIAIPYWAYSNANWYLLFGIAFSYFGSYSASSPRLKSYIFLFTIISLGVWIGEGFSIHQYITFFFFCSLWGYLTAKIAEEYDQLKPIPDDVKMFVWQRDGGRCIKCGSQENLEYYHIIPVSNGGDHTAFNIQLLCEKCNRSKSANIV
jgi:hypothetical protein